MNNIYARDISFLKRSLLVEFNTTEKNTNLSLMNEIRELPHICEAEFRRSLKAGSLTQEFGQISVLVDKEQYVAETQNLLAQIKGIKSVEKLWNNYN